MFYNVTGTNSFVVIELQNSAKKYFKVGTAGEYHYGKREVFQVKDIFQSRKLRFCILSLVIGFKMSRHIGVQSIFTPAFTRLESSTKYLSVLGLVDLTRSH